jgi:DNA mismatch repair protein MLH1
MLHTFSSKFPLPSLLTNPLRDSIDAGATRIAVTVKEGGLRLLQVADDGCGVARADLPLLCVRHATSKLRAYEDLEAIATLGFRGEALASISFVAHLSATTMTRGAAHGWRASYQDGALLDPPGAKPCAAVPGTVLTVEDLFFNVPARRKAFRAGGAEEGALVLDLMQVGVLALVSDSGEVREGAGTGDVCCMRLLAHGKWSTWCAMRRSRDAPRHLASAPFMCASWRHSPVPRGTCATHAPQSLAALRRVGGPTRWLLPAPPRRGTRGPGHLSRRVAPGRYPPAARPRPGRVAAAAFRGMRPGTDS